MHCSRHIPIVPHPPLGSLRYDELGLRDLRSMTLKGFTYIVFYLEQADRCCLPPQFFCLIGRR